MNQKRILFVEDNSLLLSMYEMMMSDEPERWKITTAASAEEALVLVQQSPFDVVVSDMNLPGLCGVELLGEVRKLQPRASRIIISGQHEQEEVARCLAMTHQFLTKPFGVKVLKAALHCIVGLDAYLTDERLKSLVGQLSGLPAFPSLYVEMMDELGSEEPSIEKLAASIAQDPGMTAKVLQVVNSAALGLPRRINEPLEAVQYLGINTVASLILSAHVFLPYESGRLKHFSPERLMEHGIQCARLAQRIMQLERAEPEDTEHAYLAGLLHDIGKLMLASSLPDSCQQVLALMEERSLPQSQAETEILGATHAGAAAYLFGLWGMPAAIVEAVAFHHTPSRSELRRLSPLTAVHAANYLAHELTHPAPPGPEAFLDREYLQALGLEQRLEVWRSEAARLLQKRDGN